MRRRVRALDGGGGTGRPRAGPVAGLNDRICGTSCSHSSVPFVPLTRMRRQFSTPAAACVTQKLPRAPFERRNKAPA